MKINEKLTEFVDKIWCIISPNHIIIIIFSSIQISYQCEKQNWDG